MDFSWVKFEDSNNLIFLDSCNRLNCVDPLFFRLEFLKTTWIGFPTPQTGFDFIAKENKKNLKEMRPSLIRGKKRSSSSSRKLFRFEDNKPHYHRSTNIPIQYKCCIEGCAKKSSNRSVKSLKFKYKIKRKHNRAKKFRICNNHYFSDLYKFKKKKVY